MKGYLGGSSSAGFHCCHNSVLVNTLHGRITLGPIRPEAALYMNIFHAILLLQPFSFALPCYTVKKDIFVNKMNITFFNPRCIVTMSIVYVNERCLLILSVTWNEKCMVICQQKSSG